MDWDWDSVREWGVALGGLFALLFAARTYAMNAKTRREEQPRKVYSHPELVRTAPRGFEVEEGIANIDPGVVTLREDSDGSMTRVTSRNTYWYEHRIVNASDEVIGPLVAVERYHHQEGPDDVYTTRVLALEPGKDATIQSVCRGSNLDIPAVGFNVHFRDSAGRWWVRDGTRPIRRSHDPMATARQRRQATRRHWTDPLRRKIAGRLLPPARIGEEIRVKTRSN